MKISVIIPMYNSEKYIARLIESLINQTYDDYEIIIINDGSIDNSKEIVENYSKFKNNIKLYNIDNKGPGFARKYGFQRAKGELIFFVDSDDFIPNENVFKKIAMIYERKQFDILFFNFITKQNNYEKTDNAFGKNNMKEKNYDVKYIDKNIVRGALWSKIFLKSKLKENFFCTGNNYEDYYTTYMYLNECKSFFYTKEILYYSDRDNANSLSKKQIVYDKINNTIMILSEMMKLSNKRNVQLISFNYYYSIMRQLENKKEKKDIVELLENLNKLIKKNKIFSLGTITGVKNIIKYIICRIIYYKNRKKN